MSTLPHRHAGQDNCLMMAEHQLATNETLTLNTSLVNGRDSIWMSMGLANVPVTTEGGGAGLGGGGWGEGGGWDEGGAGGSGEGGAGGSGEGGAGGSGEGGAGGSGEGGAGLGGGGWGEGGAGLGGGGWGEGGGDAAGTASLHVAIMVKTHGLQRW